MRLLTETDFVELWEHGQSRNQADRALLFLRTARPVLDPEHCANLGVGQRDAAILELQRGTFGPSLGGTVTCPSCGEQLEFSIDADEIKAAPRSASADQFVASNGLHFRLPSTNDLNAVRDSPDVDTATWRLLQRCCLDPVNEGMLSDSLISEVDAGLSALDPFSQFEVGFSCVACGSEWTDWFDVCDWFWQAIEARAGRLLDDVHCLAVAYGWSEEQILKLSPVRRLAYIERCAT